MSQAILREGLIAALATPLGQSALAVIRTSGPGCVQAIAELFTRKTAVLQAKGQSLVYGSLIDPTLPDDHLQYLVDEVMLGIFRTPRSYSGEDMVEIYCHGSLPGIDRIFGLLFANGFRQAEAGEFTLRAFLNRKLDLTRAEAVQEIVSAQSRTAQSLALHRLGGAIFGRIDAIKAELVRLMAIVAIQIDYPDDEIDEIELPRDTIQAIVKNLKGLADTYRIGRSYQQGVRLALAGRTNAGKSSLFNAMVREERAIVSAIHGTTRDYLEAPFTIKGIPIRLFDTAGLREVEELLESEGIRRSGLVISAADLVLYVIDATTVDLARGIDGIPAEDSKHLSEIRSGGIHAIIVLNKVDALQNSPMPFLGPETAYLVSAQTGKGLEDLLNAVADQIMGGSNAEDADVIIDSERQYQLLNRAIAALAQVEMGLDSSISLDLVALDLQDAVAALGEITGEVSSDDVLGVVFSGFCVGK